MTREEGPASREGHGAQANRVWTRRRVIERISQLSVGALAASGMEVRGASRAPRSATWSPERYERSEEFFIIDGVVHCYNHDPVNYRKPKAEGASNAGYAYSVHAAVNPSPYQMTAEQWARDWQPEEVAEQLFLESDTDMMCMHSVPLFATYFDGLVSNAKGAYLKSRYPDRVVWYAAIDILDDPVKTFRLIDQVAQQGADGIKLYPYRVNFDTGRAEWWYMDDPVHAFPIFEYAIGKGLKHIATHKLIGYTNQKSTPYMGVADFAEAARSFPEAWFHIVHGGWMMLEETAELMRRFPNITAVMEGPMFWPRFDTGKFDEMLSVFLNRSDLDRIIYASAAANQHPYFVSRAVLDYTPGKDAGYTFGDREKRKVLGENFAKIHQIDVAARKKKLANDKWAVLRGEHGLREPFIKQRNPLYTGV